MGIKPATLSYGVDSLTNWATRPGLWSVILKWVCIVPPYILSPKCERPPPPAPHFFYFTGIFDIPTEESTRIFQCWPKRNNLSKISSTFLLRTWKLVNPWPSQTINKLGIFLSLIFFVTFTHWINLNMWASNDSLCVRIGCTQHCVRCWKWTWGTLRGWKGISRPLGFEIISNGRRIDTVLRMGMAYTIQWAYYLPSIILKCFISIITFESHNNPRVTILVPAITMDSFRRKLCVLYHPANVP